MPDDEENEGGTAPSPIPHKALTKKEEKFAQCIATGVGVLVSYRESYSVRGNENTLSRNAQRIKNKPHVAARIAEIMAEGEQVELVPTDKKYVLKGLRREAEDMVKGTSASRTRALELIGKTQGMFDETLNLNIQDRTPEQIEAELKDRLMKAFGQEAVEALAEVEEDEPPKRIAAAVVVPAQEHEQKPEGE